MQIIINEDEILEAIKEYISKQGIVIAGREITIELTAGRGPNGARATIEITKPDGHYLVYKIDEDEIDNAEGVEEETIEEDQDVVPEGAIDVFELPVEETPVEEKSTDGPTEVVGGDSLFGY